MVPREQRPTGESVVQANAARCTMSGGDDTLEGLEQERAQQQQHEQQQLPQQHLQLQTQDQPAGGAPFEIPRTLSPLTFESIYDAPSRGPLLSIENTLEDFILATASAEAKADLALMAKAVADCYVPGRYEVITFGLQSPAEWHSLAGTLPIGAFVFPISADGDTPLATKVFFPDGMAATDFFKRDLTCDPIKQLKTVEGWQDKLQLLANVEGAGGPGTEYTHPAQATFKTMRNPAAAKLRSRLAAGFRQPKLSMVKKCAGDGTEVKFEVSMFCHAPGFRSAQAIDQDTKLVSLRCNAMLEAVIIGVDATFVTLKWCEPCVHRAACMRAGHASAVGGKKLFTPTAEAYWLTLNLNLQVRFNSREAYNRHVHVISHSILVLDRSESAASLGILRRGVEPLKPFREPCTARCSTACP